MNIRSYALTGASLLLVFAIVVIWRWRPEQQVRLHQRDLLSAVEHRNWEKVGRLMADNYSDRWGHDKDFVLSGGKEVFSQFFVLQILGEASEVSTDGVTGEVRSRIVAKGTGTPIAELVTSRVNGLREPWLFRWEHRSGKPWDWKLVWIEQPELEMDQM